MSVSIKLFVTINLDTGLKMIDVNIDKPVNIIEMLKIVSDIINVDLLAKLVENSRLVSDARILLDEVNINHLNKLDTQITKNTTISIFPPEKE